MSTSLINLIALVGFLLLNLFVGYRASKGITTMKEYALANKNLGVGVLVATLGATLLDSGGI